MLFNKAREAQLAEHGFEATGAVSSSLTSSKWYILIMAFIAQR